MFIWQSILTKHIDWLRGIPSVLIQRLALALYVSPHLASVSNMAWQIHIHDVLLHLTTQISDTECFRKLWRKPRERLFILKFSVRLKELKVSKSVSRAFDLWPCTFLTLNLVWQWSLISCAESLTFWIVSAGSFSQDCCRWMNKVKCV